MKKQERHARREPAMEPENKKHSYTHIQRQKLCRCAHTHRGRAKTRRPCLGRVCATSYGAGFLLDVSFIFFLSHKFLRILWSTYPVTSFAILYYHGLRLNTIKIILILYFCNSNLNFGFLRNLKSWIGWTIHFYFILNEYFLYAFVHLKTRAITLYCFWYAHTP